MLYHQQVQVRCDLPKIGRVAGHNGLSGTSGADGDMRVGDVGCLSLREEQANGCGVPSIERNEICVGLTNEAGQSSLPCRAAHCLC